MVLSKNLVSIPTSYLPRFTPLLYYQTDGLYTFTKIFNYDLPTSKLRHLKQENVKLEKLSTELNMHLFLNHKFIEISSKIITDGRIIDLLKDRQTDSFYWPNEYYIDKD